MEALELRVAFLSPCYWPEVRRGTERFTRELADGLIELGHRPRLITSHPGRPSSAVEDGMPVMRWWRPPDDRLGRRMYEQHLTHVPFSYLSLRRGDDDVAHAVFPTDALAAARWGRRTGRPAILSYMGVPERHWLTRARLRLQILQRALRDCDAVIALSDAAARAFHRVLGADVRVIRPGVNLGAFAVAGERHPQPTIVCAADVGEPRKRVDMLIEAFRLVRRERPDARLVLSRPRDSAVLARYNGGLAGVELADLDDRAALARAYGEAWVSALPSTSEAFGLVLAEAMACGTPVVATRTGGMPEVLGGRDDVGRLFEGGERELARALVEALELAEDPATRGSCRGRAEQLSTARCAREYESLYRELAAI